MIVSISKNKKSVTGVTVLVLNPKNKDLEQLNYLGQQIDLYDISNIEILIKELTKMKNKYEESITNSENVIKSFESVFGKIISNYDLINGFKNSKQTIELVLNSLKARFEELSQPEPTALANEDIENHFDEKCEGCDGGIKACCEECSFKFNCDASYFNTKEPQTVTKTETPLFYDCSCTNTCCEHCDNQYQKDFPSKKQRNFDQNEACTNWAKRFMETLEDIDKIPQPHRDLLTDLLRQYGVWLLNK